MAALDTAEQAAWQAACRAGHGLQDTGMGALGLRQAGRDRFRLRVVLAAIGMLERVDDGQHEFCAEAPRQPGKGTAAETRPDATLAAAEPFAPERGMRLLDPGEPPVDFGNARIGLDLGERPVERRAVDLALEIRAISCLFAGLRHGC